MGIRSGESKIASYFMWDSFVVEIKEGISNFGNIVVRVRKLEV